jgi:tight adherence protein C
LILLVSVSVFLGTAILMIGVFGILEARKESLQHRLREVVGATDLQGGAAAESGRGWLDRIRARFSGKPHAEHELVERLSGKELGGARLLLSQAGYRGAGAYHTYIAIRWTTPALFAILGLTGGKATGIESRSVLLTVLAMGVVGLLLPDFFLRRKIRKRQEEIEDSLPDGLDLLVVCVEAGLGLNAAFIKITEEFRLSSPALSEEFDIVNREMVAGKPRQEALRALADRTGVEDVKSLVAMLIQTDKLGTSLAQSLRVHSDSLRTRRRQRAEEAAAKTTIKLVFPLVFLLFPALFIVILGPGVIQIINVLFQVSGE